MNSAPARFLAALLIAIALGLGISGGLLFKKHSLSYQAIATVQVVRHRTDLLDLKEYSDKIPSGVAATVFLQNEAEMVLSATVLGKAIEQLDLNIEWGRRYNDGQKLRTQETAAFLKERATITPLLDSSQLRIQIAGEDTEEPQKIANALAQAYCDYRLERIHRIAQSTIDSLAESYSEAEKKSQAAEIELSKAKQQLDASLRTLETPPQPSMIESDTVLRELQSQRSKAMMTHIFHSNYLALNTNLSAEQRNDINTRVQAATKKLEDVEASLRTETLKQQSLKAYWQARHAIEDANLAFKPLKEPIEDARRDLAPQTQAPASITERAVAALPLPPRIRPQEKYLFMGAGILLIAGVGILLSTNNLKTQG